MRPEPPPTTEPERIITQLTAGVRWIWDHLLIRCMILSAAGFNIVFAALYLTVVVAARTAGATSVQIGIMLGMASAGGFAGSPRIVTRQDWYLRSCGQRVQSSR